MQWYDCAIDLLGGTVGGSLGVLSGHPFDTIKVRLQSSSEYRGAFQALSRIVREEGVRGLYKGMSSPLISVGFQNSLLFAVNGITLRALQVNDEPPGYGQLFLAGLVSGGASCIISSPIELIKIRLQNQRGLSSSGQFYTGSLDCARKIVAQKGLKGLYKGVGCTLWREVPSYGVYFVSFEFLCRQLDANPDEAELPGLALLFSGGVAGVLAWFVTYPFDVVKTRLQDLREELHPRYKSTFRGLSLIYRKEGLRALFSGWWATAIRAFPTNAAIFYGVSLVKSFS